MSVFQLPARPSVPAYRYRIDLDGEIFVLDYEYNSRMGKWLLQIEDEEGEVLIAHAPIIVNWPIFERFIQEELPAGVIAAYDSSGQNEDPGRFDLGSRVKMIYREAENG